MHKLEHPFKIAFYEPIVLVCVCADPSVKNSQNGFHNSFESI